MYAFSSPVLLRALQVQKFSTSRLTYESDFLRILPFPYCIKKKLKGHEEFFRKTSEQLISYLSERKRSLL
jgi:hypothetical protein